MDLERQRRIQSVVEETLELAEGDRADFVREACGGDSRLEQEVFDLLLHDEQAGDFLEHGADLSGFPIPGELPEIGRYRLLDLIGSGGMSSVYLAERADGEFHQQVAIKFVRFGFERPDTSRRFAAERQFLADLEHPFIARLLDGGSYGGAPFLVLEYVEGQPLTEYCDDNRLTITERLRLFLKVCEAVRHAHRNLVVHRDLKPGNVLVTAEGLPKLLDFGIAKLLAASDVDATATRERYLTPAYASPEQRRGEKVTTATDVYSLGVLLHELLVGVRPFSDDTAVEGGRPLELQRRLDQRPETEILLTARALSASTSGLRRELASDLSTVVLKALEPEPDDRYDSVEQLANDLERFLDGQPVEAHPPSIRYLLRKRLRKHRIAVVAIATAILALALFACLTAFHARQVARERDRAREMSRILIDGFELADPERGDSVPVSKVLDEGVQRFANQTSDRPSLRADLFTSVGSIYRKLGLYDRALQLLEEAIAAREAAEDAPSLVADTLHELGRLALDRAEYTSAREHLDRAVELLERNRGAGSPRLAAVLESLGDLERMLQQHEEATAVYQRALELREGEETDEAGMANTLTGLAAARRDLADYDEAEELLRRALDLRAATYGEDDPRTVRSLFGLGMLYRDMARYEEAGDLLRRALAIREEVYGPEHPSVANTLNGLGLVHYNVGRYGEAESLFSRAVAITEARYPQNQIHADYLNNLAMVHSARGDYGRSGDLYRRALAIRQQTHGEDHPEVADAYANLAGDALATGDVERGAALFERALDILEARFGAEHPRVARMTGNVAIARFHQGRRNEAGELFRRAFESARASLGNEHRYVALTLVNLGAYHSQTGNVDRAIECYEEALEIRREVLGGESSLVAETATDLAGMYLEKGEHRRAEKHLLSAIQVWRSRAESDPQSVRRGNRLTVTLMRLANLYEDSGRGGDAERALREIVTVLEPYRDEVEGVSELEVYAEALRRLDREKEAEQVLARLEECCRENGAGQPLVRRH